MDLGADLVAVEGGLLGLRPGRLGDRPFGAIILGVEDREVPAGKHRRVDVLGLRRRAGDADEARRAVRFLGYRAGLGAHPDHPRRELRCLPGDGEAGEIVPDKEGDRLAEIERRLAGGAEEIAGIKVRHGDPRGRKIGREHDTVGLQLGVEERQVDALEDVCGVGGLEEERVRGLVRPAGHVGGTEIGGVNLLARDLGPALDAARGGCRRGLPRRAAGGFCAGRARNRLGEATKWAKRDRNACHHGHSEEAAAIKAQAG